MKVSHRMTLKRSPGARRAGPRRRPVQPRWRYGNGEGVDAEAVAWFRLAAEQGLAGAQNNLGVKYALGLGVGPRMTLKRSPGTAWPPSRATPAPSSTSGGCTPAVGASRRMTLPRTCG